MLTFNFEVSENYTLTVTDDLITIDDGKEKAYFVPSSKQVFLKTVRTKAQNLIILYKVTLKVSLLLHSFNSILCFQNTCTYVTGFYETVKEGDLVLGFKSLQKYICFHDKFKDAQFEITDQKVRSFNAHCLH